MVIITDLISSEDLSVSGYADVFGKVQGQVDSEIEKVLESSIVYIH